MFKFVLMLALALLAGCHAQSARVQMGAAPACVQTGNGLCQASHGQEFFPVGAASPTKGGVHAFTTNLHSDASRTPATQMLTFQFAVKQRNLDLLEQTLAAVSGA